MSEHALPPNGITGVLWVYSAMTILGILAVVLGLRKRTPAGGQRSRRSSPAAWLQPGSKSSSTSSPSSPRRIKRWLADHPLRNVQFTFFIFIVVPVQTLFAHAWLTMPLYIERAYRSTPLFSQNFEFFSGLNPLLIFIMTPIVAALTARINVYRMMIIGTTVMAAPTFLLAFGPSPTLLILNSLLTSLGEALGSPASCSTSPRSRPRQDGAVHGHWSVSWFLTKVLTGMYSGWFPGALLSCQWPAEHRVPVAGLRRDRHGLADWPADRRSLGSSPHGQGSQGRRGARSSPTSSDRSDG